MMEPMVPRETDEFRGVSTGPLPHLLARQVAELSRIDSWRALRDLALDSGVIVLLTPHNVRYHVDHHLYPSVPYYRAERSDLSAVGIGGSIPSLAPVFEHLTPTSSGVSDSD